MKPLQMQVFLLRYKRSRVFHWNAHSTVESTDKCKIKQSFCSTLLLMFQTFVFAWCDIFCCTRAIFWFILHLQCPTNYQKTFSKVHLSPASTPNAHA